MPITQSSGASNVNYRTPTRHFAPYELETKLRKPSRATQSVPVDTDVTVSFGTPTFVLATDLFQEFRVQARVKGATTGFPKVRIELWENGTFLTTALTDQVITSTSGVVLVGVWDAAMLTDSSGAGVECRVFGGGALAGSIEIGAIEWNAVSSVIPVLTMTSQPITFY